MKKVMRIRIFKTTTLSERVGDFLYYFLAFACSMPLRIKLILSDFYCGGGGLLRVTLV